MGMWVVQCICVLSHIWLFAKPWTVAHQAPLSMGFFRQEYWSGLPFHSPGQYVYHSSLMVTLGFQFSSVQSLSCVRLFATPWITACQVSLSITNSRSLLKLMPIESLMPSSCLILCCPLLLLPSIFPSIRVFSNESTLHEVARVLEFQLQHQSFQWTPRTDLL